MADGQSRFRQISTKPKAGGWAAVMGLSGWTSSTNTTIGDLWTKFPRLCFLLPLNQGGFWRGLGFSSEPLQRVCFWVEVCVPAAFLGIAWAFLERRAVAPSGPSPRAPPPIWSWTLRCESASATPARPQCRPAVQLSGWRNELDTLPAGEIAPHSTLVERTAPSLLGAKHSSS